MYVTSTLTSALTFRFWEPELERKLEGECYEATASGGAANVGQLAIPITRAQEAALTTPEMMVGVRPEGWQITDGDQGLAVRVDAIEELGSEAFLYCSVDDGKARTAVVVRSEGLSSRFRGDKIHLLVQSGVAHLFDRSTGERLPDA